ncbi:Nucleolar pre-ribosomal-associated protein 1 [Geodia barretti]|uniref:Nucleolar pre-ribosomal-associated protein 1 n=1 Tax=Geodia barretti TaxID=519541 RepID=A0AA35RUS6_GEOBA|nr:Nucleolar pre-ribosomal-associated protein 1 [Geodia barretti]
MDTSLDHFPQHSPLEPVDPFSERGDEGRCEERGEQLVVYDPAFMLPLASHLLDPGCLVEVREVVRTGVLSYLLVSLSSHETDVRRAAAHCISRFASHLHSSSSREKPQLSLLLRVVKNTLDEEPQRLPSLHALFLARVAQVFLQPECQLYMKAGHYLVHKPTLELRDIPLFNTLFLHTTSPQDVGECEWLLRVLGGGLRCEEDYRLYQRKRVLPHLLALYTELSLDSKTRTLILELVLRACVFPVAVCDLVWNHGLLPWLTQATSCSDQSVVQRILSKACKLVEEEDSDSDRGWKPPPLLEEELSLTTARFM